MFFIYTKAMNIKDKVEQYSIEQYAKQHSLQGKKVLLRIDVNTPLGENGVVDPYEDWRIMASLKTINFLSSEGASVVVISHIGRAKEERLKPIADYLSQKITIGYIPHFDESLIQERIEALGHGDVIMLENIRQFDGEENNDAEYLKNIANACDIYVNDAFSVSHRKHASVHAVTSLLPSYFGIQFVHEVSSLYDVTKREGTTSLILGGAKFGTKLDLLKKMLPHISYAMIGGALANVFLKERGFNIGASYVDDTDISDIVDNEKIIVMIDAIDQDGDVVSVDEIQNHDVMLDIGPETEKLFEHIIAASDTILWNGPMGKYEDGYTSGSISVAESCAHAPAWVVTGGGDTATVLQETNLIDTIDVVSTGGGAMLDFLVEGTLPGIEAIVGK